ncbi:hypothetical protein EDC01DRAFT_754870 [Geopyxis carbonaria]|nr:hypothetical protein EDC01DRAFT_754870 [Geopyxis carbonaria]
MPTAANGQLLKQIEHIREDALNCVLSNSERLNFSCEGNETYTSEIIGSLQELFTEMQQSSYLFNRRLFDLCCENAVRCRLADQYEQSFTMTREIRNLEELITYVSELHGWTADNEPIKARARKEICKMALSESTCINILFYLQGIFSNHEDEDYQRFAKDYPLIDENRRPKVTNMQKMGSLFVDMNSWLHELLIWVTKVFTYNRIDLIEFTYSPFSLTCCYMLAGCDFCNILQSGSTDFPMKCDCQGSMMPNDDDTVTLYGAEITSDESKLDLLEQTLNDRLMIVSWLFRIMYPRYEGLKVVAEGFVVAPCVGDRERQTVTRRNQAPGLEITITRVTKRIKTY